MASSRKRWSQLPGHTPVPPHFEALRHAPRHLLLGELQHTLLLNLALPAQKHFQGLATGAKYHRAKLDNRLAAKLRLIDDSHHLMEHLTPESAANFVQEIHNALAGSFGTNHCSVMNSAQVKYGSIASTYVDEGNTSIRDFDSTIEIASNSCSDDCGLKSIAVGTDMPVLSALESFYFDDDDGTEELGNQPSVSLATPISVDSQYAAASHDASDNDASQTVDALELDAPTSVGSVNVASSVFEGSEELGNQPSHQLATPCSVDSPKASVECEELGNQPSMLLATSNTVDSPVVGASNEEGNQPSPFATTSSEDSGAVATHGPEASEELGSQPSPPLAMLASVDAPVSTEQVASAERRITKWADVDEAPEPLLVEGNPIQAHICTNTSDDLDGMHIDITSAFAIANTSSDGRIQVAICDSCGSLATPRLRVLSGYVACGCSDVPVFHLSYAVKKGRKRRK